MKEEQSKQDVRALFHFFSRNIREQLLALPLEADGMEEVRLRVSAPLYYIYKNKEYTAGSGFRVSREDVDETLQCAARSSLYAYGEEIRQGFLTVQGGHRIGVAGRTILENGHIKAIHPITFLNVRFSHQMIGCAAKIRSILTDPGAGSIRNTLLIAPPRCGKTTLLRDLIRMVSDGEEGKDRGSALRGSFERSKAGAGHENKAGKMVEMRKQHGGKVRAQTVGVVDEIGVVGQGGFRVRLYHGHQPLVLRHFLLAEVLLQDNQVTAHLLIITCSIVLSSLEHINNFELSFFLALVICTNI